LWQSKRKICMVTNENRKVAHKVRKNYTSITHN